MVAGVAEVMAVTAVVVLWETDMAWDGWGSLALVVVVLLLVLLSVLVLRGSR